jgi:hypothetical protein
MSRMTPLLVITVVGLVAILVLRGGQVMTALVIDQTNSTFSTVNVSNDAPAIFDVRCWDADTNTLLDVINGLSLVGGDQKTIYCNATAIDSNGVSDMVMGFGSVHTDQVNEDCGEDNRNCYVNNTCANQTDINSTAREIRCTYKLWFNADNTTIFGSWTPNITVQDTTQYSVATMVNRTNFSVNTLLAIGVDPGIAFGSKTAGVNMTNVGSGASDSATTCAGATGGCNHTSYNYGNVRIDIQVNSSTLSCTLAGSITAGYLHANLTYDSIYSQSYALTNTLAGPFGDFDLAENNTAGVLNYINPTPTAKQTYWGIGVPPATSGNCQGAIHFAAIAG